MDSPDRAIDTPPADGDPNFRYAPAGAEAEPCLTVITRFFDTKVETLVATARALERQSLQQWEWLILHDSSAIPGSSEALAPYRGADRRIRVVDLEGDLGGRDQRGGGIQLARSDFVLHLNGGDLPVRTTLETWLWFLVTHPEYAFVDQAGVGADLRSRSPSSPPVELAGGSPILIRKTALEAATEPDGAAPGATGSGPISTLRVELEALPCTNLLAKPNRRLLLVVPWITVGGSDRVNLDLVAQLNGRKWETTVVTTVRGGYEWLPELLKLTPDILVLPHFLEAADFPRFFHYAVRSRRPDVILVSNSHFAYTALPYLRTVAGHIPLTDYCHSDEDWDDGGYPRMSLRSGHLIDLTIAASDYVKRWMVERGADPDRIEVCHANVADGEQGPYRRADLDLPEDVPIIVYACRVCDVKQPRVFAKTMLALRERKLGFLALVIGDGPELAWLEGFLRRRELEGCVRVLGSQSNRRTRELMGMADVVFLPSRSEGIAITLYEALAEGTPVVAADVGGQRELVTPECGILVERDPNEKVEVERYAEALAELLSNGVRRREMGEAGRARITALFTVDRFGARMDELLSRAIELATASPRSVPTPDDARAAALEAVRTLLD